MAIVHTAQSRVPQIGDIYSMCFDGEGCEQKGWRPGVIFQNNVGNLHSPNVIVLPLTSSLKKLNMPTHILLRAADTGLLKDSVVICENPQRMSKDRLGKYITTLSPRYMKEIAAASLIATSAISFMDLESLIAAWQQAVKLNKPVA